MILLIGPSGIRIGVGSGFGVGDGVTDGVGVGVGGGVGCNGRNGTTSSGVRPGTSGGAVSSLGCGGCFGTIFCFAISSMRRFTSAGVRRLSKRSGGRGRLVPVGKAESAAFNVS